ncbi:MAG: hypothetical protein ACOCX9_02020 [Spirochaetota bacterium]
MRVKKRITAASGLIILALVLSCATFIEDEQAASLDTYQEGIYRMKQDVKVNELVLKKGEKVKLMVIVEEDAVKAYAYPADVSYLKADRVLILYMFDADFKEGVFDKKYFHTRLMEIVEPVG